MKETLALKDMITLSAYLDGRLPGIEAQRLEKRLKEDIEFNKAFLEIRHTRQLLQSLPQKRAPRNFTLSGQAAGKPVRRWGTHSFFSLASATAALALVVLAGMNLLTPRLAMKAAPPAADFALQESAPVAGMLAEAEVEATPLIFNWNPQFYADGRGGGGGGEDPKAMTAFDTAVESPEALPVEPFVQSEAETAEEALPEAPAVDPSTMILGLPEAGTEGEMLTTEAEEPPSREANLPATTLWMIGLGAATLVFAVLAFMLRRR